MSIHSINWFEIPVADFDRAKEFYSTIFDYDMPVQQAGSSKIGFLPFDSKRDGVGGAIVQGEGYVPTIQGAKIYLNAGKDLSKVLKLVKVAGGQVLMDKQAMGANYGYFAFIMDSEGNLIGLRSPE